MGVIIYAKNCSWDFEGTMFGFVKLRKRIAMRLDKEFGEHYDKIDEYYANIDEYHKNFENKVKEIIKRKNLDIDILDFLFSYKTKVKINYKTCKKIYDIIKDDTESLSFTYFSCNASKDYENFKAFLRECYSKRKNMYWRWEQ